MTDWHRIEKVVKWTGLSVNAFSRAIGLNRSENLYRIKRGNNGISRELADTICAKYPTVSKSWLLLGEGEMFTGEESGGEVRQIPFYSVGAENLMAFEQLPEPVCYLSFPIFHRANFIAVQTERGMEPAIPFGAFVVYQLTNVDALTPGENYLVVSDRFTGVRTVRKELYSSQLRLVPKNTEDFDELQIDKEQIRKVYAILGIIVTKG